MEPNQRDPSQAAAVAPATPSNVRKAQVRAALFRRAESIRIGRFVLLEPLGAGAMGEIYAAYDEQLDRKVALKLVRNGSAVTANADERLLREAQTLAQVSHPNVVQIYEAGAYNGRLFIAMELVRGKTLTSWLRAAAQLPRGVRHREILRQFIAAGRGLEAAHAAGVAHRDFKPDNVLVGDDGRVRVVDFGLARALVDDEMAGGAAAGTAGAAGVGPAAGSAGADGVVVGAGGPMVAAAAVSRGDDERAAEATPSSSPPVGVAQDIASGPTVMLAQTVAVSASEVLFATGAETIDHMPDPAQLAAARGEAPASPAKPRAVSHDGAASSGPRLKAALQLTETGTVMGTPFFMAPEQMRGALADRRSDQFSFCVALYHALYDAFPFSGRSLRELIDSMRTDEVAFAPGVPVPTSVRRALHRGLSVDPAHRFAGMAELLAALEPRARRLRGWFAAAVAASVVAVAAALVLSSQPADPCAAAGSAIDAPWLPPRQLAIHGAFLRGGLPFAESTWHGVKTQLDGYTQRWRDEATAACQATHVTHTQSAEQLDKRMLCLDRGRRQLAALVAELGTGASEAVEHAIEATAALPALDACSHAENLLFGVAPPPAAIAPAVASIRDRLAQALTLELMGRYEESLAIARDANAAADHVGYAPVHAEALTQVARAMDGRITADTRPEIQRLYFEALTIAETEHDDKLAISIWGRLVILATRMDSNMTRAHEWWGQAYAWSRRSIADLHGTKDESSAEARAQYLLGEIYYREGRYGDAAEAERRAIASISPDNQLELSRYENTLAKSLQFLNRLDEALQLHQHALKTATEAFGAGHPIVVALEVDYSEALKKRGHVEQARSLLEHALMSMAERDRSTRPLAAIIHGVLSDLDYAAGHLDRAAENGQASLEIYRRTLAPDHIRLAEAYTNLANVELKRRKFEHALSLYQDALSLRRSNLSGDHYQLGVNEGSIAETLLDLDLPDEAMPHLLEAERIFLRGVGQERETKAWILTIRGELLVAEQSLDFAIPVLEQALPLFGADADPTNHALAMWTLARALHGLGKEQSRVRTLAEAAHAILKSLGSIEAYDCDAVERFLRGLPRSPDMRAGGR